jgi:hypothetical protein
MSVLQYVVNAPAVARLWRLSKKIAVLKNKKASPLILKLGEAFFNHKNNYQITFTK